MGSSNYILLIHIMYVEWYVYLSRDDLKDRVISVRTYENRLFVSPTLFWRQMTTRKKTIYRKHRASMVLLRCVQSLLNFHCHSSKMFFFFFFTNDPIEKWFSGVFMCAIKLRLGENGFFFFFANVTYECRFSSSRH